MFGRKKHPVRKVPYDPQTHAPALRCSICNGEQVGGLRNKATGAFEELLLIRDEADLAAFREMLSLSPSEEIPRFY